MRYPVPRYRVDISDRVSVRYPVPRYRVDISDRVSVRYQGWWTGAVPVHQPTGLNLLGDGRGDSRLGKLFLTDGVEALSQSDGVEVDPALIASGEVFQFAGLLHVLDGLVLVRGDLAQGLEGGVGIPLTGVFCHLSSKASDLGVGFVGLGDEAHGFGAELHTGFDEGFQTYGCDVGTGGEIELVLKGSHLRGVIAELFLFVQDCFVVVGVMAEGGEVVDGGRADEVVAGGVEADGLLGFRVERQYTFALAGGDGLQHAGFIGGREAKGVLIDDKDLDARLVHVGLAIVLSR